MYGHYYNYDTSKWEDRLALWVCYVDPIRRYFKTSKDEYRHESFENIPIHYFSVKYTEIKIHETMEVYLEAWRNVQAESPLFVGMGFSVKFQLDVSSYHFSDSDSDSNDNSANFIPKFKHEKEMATIGPSVKSIYTDIANIPDNWYFTVSHAFKVDDDPVIACGDPIYDWKGETEIGILVDIYSNPSVDWAIIALTDVQHSPNVKSTASKHVPIAGTVDFDSFNINSPWHLVFKSGARTGVTKGKIFSWGYHLNGTDFPTHTDDSIASPSEILIQRYSSTNLFSDNGDSGSPLLTMEDNDIYRCIGLVTSNLTFHHRNLILATVTPIYHQKNHIRKFVTSALNRYGLLI
mmetsp:Transcript_14405/g.13024  ORF Transcript_14405/g.13024 Transcript_14405/m.13024 type:complete len:349 (-) Transcript_14405:168-1214(-)